MVKMNETVPQLPHLPQQPQHHLQQPRQQHNPQQQVVRGSSVVCPGYVFRRNIFVMEREIVDWAMTKIVVITTLTTGDLAFP